MKKAFILLSLVITLNIGMAQKVTFEVDQTSVQLFSKKGYQWNDQTLFQNVSGTVEYDSALNAFFFFFSEPVMYNVQYWFKKQPTIDGMCYQQAFVMSNKGKPFNLVVFTNQYDDVKFISIEENRKQKVIYHVRKIY
jgi:hypothetical protein